MSHFILAFIAGMALTIQVGINSTLRLFSGVLLIMR
jgi:uncharacterized membrane protein YdcZ (DUF606 family)